MNLYLRLIRIIFKMLFAEKAHPLETSKLCFRAWPHDCDINLHMTNARYLALMDLGRTFLIGQMGLLSKIFKRKWLPVVSSIEISYFREIKPFQKFQVHTLLLDWDDKYWYIGQKFFYKETLLASAMVRGIFMKDRRKIAFPHVVELVDAHIKKPTTPDPVYAWKNLLEEKKKSTSS